MHADTLCLNLPHQPSIAVHNLKMEPASPTTCVKLQDLEQTPPLNILQLASGLTTASLSATSQTTTAKSGSTHAQESKPPKKRKSWGQALPTPKTNLPPRKRAKTEDEKEQRRIERIQRNRLAAHNSRERKRKEVEELMDEKNALAQQLNFYRDAFHYAETKLAQMENRDPDYKHAQVAALQVLTPPLTDSPSMSSIHDVPAFAHASPDSQFDMQMTTPNMTTSSPSVTTNCTPETPTLDFTGVPLSTTTSMTGPGTSAEPTQHSAAMLCPDLQCRSAPAPRPSSRRPLPHTSSSSLTFPWATFFSTMAILLCSLASWIPPNRWRSEPTSRSSSATSSMTTTRSQPPVMSRWNAVTKMTTTTTRSTSPCPACSKTTTSTADSMSPLFLKRRLAQAQRLTFATSRNLLRKEGGCDDDARVCADSSGGVDVDRLSDGRVISRRSRKQETDPGDRGEIQSHGIRLVTRLKKHGIVERRMLVHARRLGAVAF